MDLMDEFAISKKRRSIATRRPRHDPDQAPTSPPDHAAAAAAASGLGFRKREFLLNAPPPPPPPATDEARPRRTAAGSQPAVYRRAPAPSKHRDKDKQSPSRGESSTALREKKVTKVKVKVGGVSRTIHQHKQQNLHMPEPPRKSNRMNKKRVLDEESPPPYEKPLADSINIKTKKKRVSKDPPSDASTDYETGEEEEAAPVAAGAPQMEGTKTKNLTSRQRAMLKGGKDSGRVEFPEGLPPPPSRSKNTKTSQMSIMRCTLLVVNCRRKCNVNYFIIE